MKILPVIIFLAVPAVFFYCIFITLLVDLFNLEYFRISETEAGFYMLQYGCRLTGFSSHYRGYYLSNSYSSVSDAENRIRHIKYSIAEEETTNMLISKHTAIKEIIKTLK